MIIDRMVARLAAISALNNFMQEPFPTLAGALIFDSRIEAVEDFKEDPAFPACIVYTDYDKDHWPHHSANNGDRTLTVTFEFFVGQVKELPGSGFQVAYPNTDPELELALDLFEAQIAEALALNNSAADCWRYLMTKYVNVISRRGATAEGGTKLAARQVTVEAVLPRGPTVGVVPPAVGKFLDELETHDDYKVLVPTLRSAYTAPSTLTAAEQLMRVMGWSDDVAARLGYTRGDPVTLPDNVVYLDSQGNPLP